MVVNSASFAGVCIHLCVAPGPSISQLCVYTVPSTMLSPKSLWTQPGPHIQRCCQVLSEISKSSFLLTSLWRWHPKPMAANAAREGAACWPPVPLGNACFLGWYFILWWRLPGFWAQACLAKDALTYGRHYSALCEVCWLSHSLLFFHPGQFLLMLETCGG